MDALMAVPNITAERAAEAYSNIIANWKVNTTNIPIIAKMALVLRLMC